MSFSVPCSLAVALKPEEIAWVSFGMLGNVIFGSRFFIQWLYSEKHQESKVPTIFWWISIAGTCILFTYFLHKREWVALWGNGPQLIPYTRNLILIYRKKRQNPDALEALNRETPEERALVAATHPDL